MKEMMKKVLMLVALLFMASSVNAQILILDDEFEGNERVESEEPYWGTFVPIEGQDADQYTPLDGGWIFLVGMGSAYLMRKGRSKEREKKRLKN